MSKFPSCQIFRRNRRGVNVTFLPIGPPRLGKGAMDKAISPYGLEDSMAMNVATLPITVGVVAFLVREITLLVVRKTYGSSRGLLTIPTGNGEPRVSIVQTD